MVFALWRREGKIAVEQGAEHGRADFSCRAFLSQTVERHENAGVRIGDQMQIAVEGGGVAGMADDAMAVAVLVIEAEVTCH